MKKHKFLGIRTVYTITCGSCQTEFEESSGDQLDSNDGMEVNVGDWIECPECESELELSDPYSDDEEEESDDQEDDED